MLLHTTTVVPAEDKDLKDLAGRMPIICQARLNSSD